MYTIIYIDKQSPTKDIVGACTTRSPIWSVYWLTYLYMWLANESAWWPLWANQMAAGVSYDSPKLMSYLCKPPVLRKENVNMSMCIYIIYIHITYILHNARVITCFNMTDFINFPTCLHVWRISKINPRNVCYFQWKVLFCNAMSCSVSLLLSFSLTLLWYWAGN